MQDIKSLLDDLAEEAARRRDMQNNVAMAIKLVEEEIVGLMKKIQTLETLQESESYFIRLMEIQEKLSELLYKYKLQLPENIINFIKECERLDDLRLREYLYNKIQSNKYSFEQLSTI